jgi:D-3-phosphoglycerate dehydrogenase
MPLASEREVSSSYDSLSTSPVLNFNPSPGSPWGFTAADRRRKSSTHGLAGALANAKQLKPFVTGDIKILLLENVNKTGRDSLEKQGYQVEFHKSSLGEEELIQKIRSDCFSNEYDAY